MKNKVTLLSFFLAFTSLVAFAQKTVDAADIIKDIKAGKSISISNATIEGILDFTYMDEKLEDLPKRKKKRWWNNKGLDNKIKNQIDVNISFTNCTFKDDVLAYFPDGEDSGYTFVANFEEDAMFKDCKFEGKAMFKYSDFEKDASFQNSKFQDDTTFKYAKFKNNISFKNTGFENDATFKYAEFRIFIDFSNSTFSENATFKYAKFKEGVSFKNVQFEEGLNIKYTQVRGKFDISGMKVAFDIDSKYTKINGKSFSKYLLSNQ
ncbi:MAG: pentapeptide repeat-containing protein [Flavobacteriaceae bacterium]